MKNYKIAVEAASFGRQYLIDDVAYPSITTVLGSQDSSFLTEWQNRIGIEAANKISEHATKRGNIIHDLAEKYLLTDKDNSSGYYKHLFSPVKKYLVQNIQEIYETETVLFSKKLKTAGRTDLIAKVDNKYKVIDFKTSNKPKKKEWIKNYHLQSSFYCLAYTEMNDIFVNDYEIVIVDEQTFKVNVFKDSMLNHIRDFIPIRKEFQKCYGI